MSQQEQLLRSYASHIAENPRKGMFYSCYKHVKADFWYDILLEEANQQIGRGAASCDPITLALHNAEEYIVATEEYNGTD